MDRRNIYVYADWSGLPQPILMGNLYSEMLRGKEIFSFEYAEAWLKSPVAMLLDPDLQMYPGKHYLNDNQKVNFGVFLDSAPDRWGRLLMLRREQAFAKTERRSERNLFETDYLLGVYDQYRIGALRFKETEDGPFLNDDHGLAVPPWTRIRELEEISLRLENDQDTNSSEYLNWLNILLAPGSSLGGARPKASVLDQNNHLWIAKFPSKHDITDVGAWEQVASELGRMSGINVAKAQIQKLTSRHNTYLTKRFDRTTKGERLHFASAMTMLGYYDGQNFADGASYLEIAEFIIAHGAKVNEDLAELWRRIVFNICISNTDDHLRNHGFLLTDLGWILSPAYDINPNETGTGLSLNISETDNTLDLELAFEMHEYYRLTKSAADQILQEVTEAVSRWRELASKYQISKQEQEIKSRAFKY